MKRFSVRLVVHPHADSHIRTQAELERLLNESDSRCTNLCPDTGHVAYGGGDNLDLIRRFGEAVKRGVCVSPPAGVLKPADVIAELARLNAELSVIVEQDLYPCAPEVPLPIAISTREHLAGCGLSGTRRPNFDR